MHLKRSKNESPPFEDCNFSRSSVASIFEGLDGYAYQNGYRSMEQRSAVIFGLNFNDPFYTRPIIGQLLDIGLKHFSSSHILAARFPANISETSQSADCRIVGAKDKKLRKIVQEKSDTSLDSPVAKIIDWKNQVKDNLGYRRIFEEIKKKYRQNSYFYCAVNYAAQAELQSNNLKTSERRTLVSNLTAAYLKQLAFLEVAPNILRCDNLAFASHKPIPLFEHYIAGEFDGRERGRLGLVLIKS